MQRRQNGNPETIGGPDGLRRSMSVTQSVTTNRTDYMLDSQNVVQEFHEALDQNDNIAWSGAIR